MSAWRLGVVVSAFGTLGYGQLIMAQQRAVAAHVTEDASRKAQDILARRMTVQVTRVSLEQAIDSVSRLANVLIEFQAPLLEAYTSPVTLDVRQIALGEVLERVLDGTTLRVVLGGRGNLIIVGGEASGADSVPQVGTVSGRVIDSVTGQGISRATVKVAGTHLSVAAGDSGRFTIKNVPVGDGVLTVRAFGYRPAERSVTVNEGMLVTVRIGLGAAPNVLSGVVTTATGQQRKVEVGNDITSLNVDSLQRVAPITSVTDLLEARVPGLTVVHSSGIPGDPSRLRLRGPGSIYGENDPVVIVNGTRVYGDQSDPRNHNQSMGPDFGTPNGAVNTSSYARPSPLDQIDPNSIETIEVLKGPSASALYGSDAASGVIVITTKQGRAGPTTWDAQLGYGVNWLPGAWPTNYYRFGTQNNKSSVRICGWSDLGCTTDSIVAFQALNDSRYTILSHGHDQTANLTVSGGTGPLTYSLTGSVAGTLGNLKLPEIQKTIYETFYGAIPGWMVRPDNYHTWGVNGSLSAHPTPQVLVNLQSNLFTSTQQRSSLEQAISGLDGEYIDSTQLTNRSLVEGYVTRVTSDQLSSTNSLTVTWTPRPWLPLTMTGGINTIESTDNAYVPYGISRGGNGDKGTSDTTGLYGLGHGTSRNQTLSMGTVVPLLGQRMSLALGGNVYSQTTTDFSIATNLLAPGVSVPTSFMTRNSAEVIQNSPGTQSTTAKSTYGWYVEPRINVLSRFFVSPGFRLDGGSGGSTSSGSVGGLSAFPKIDLSYLAVDRQTSPPFLGILTQLRPRFAFGFAGTQPDPQDKLRLLNNQGVSDVVPLNDSTTLPIVALGSLGNTQLRPERSSELEGGVDAMLWRGRLSFTYTQYNKLRHDALQLITPAPSIASTPTSNYYYINNAYWVNIGEIRNTGTEMTLQATVLQRRALSWNVGANLSSVHNQVVRLNAGEAPIVLSSDDIKAGQVRITPGYPLFGIWARPIAAFADANHDGVIEPSEFRLADSAVYVGQPNPNYQLTFTTDLSLLNGRLGVHGAFAYQNGLTQTNAGACQSGAFSLLPNVPHIPLATEAAVVAADCDGNGFTGGTPIGLIQTVNLFRFQSLSINYEVPQHIAMWFQVPRMTLALQGANLGLHTNYRGKDPSVNAFSTVSAGDQTVDVGQIPEPRTWWLKVTLSK